MKKPQNPVQMAVIGAPHGVKGEVRVKTFTGDPLALGEYGPLFDAQGRAYTIAAIRPAKAVVVVRFREIASREAAESATGTELFIDRAALPDDLEEEEFYHADLVGLAARDDTGETVGTVTAVHDFGGGDLLEVALSGRRTVMIPFTRAAIPKIAVSEGFILIDPVAAGLADEGEEAG